MRDQYTVDGVTLTGAQIEAAYAAINAPETAAEKHGMVRQGWWGDEWLLLDPARVRPALEAAETIRGMVVLKNDGTVSTDVVFATECWTDRRVSFTLFAREADRE